MFCKGQVGKDDDVAASCPMAAQYVEVALEHTVYNEVEESFHDKLRGPGAECSAESGPVR